MADTVTDNTVTIEDAGPCRKKISITIPAATVDESIEGSFDTVSEEAALPGFRRGRVPRRLLEKRFGLEVRREAKQRLVSEAYTNAITDHDLQVVGEPEGNDELEALELAPGAEATFSLEVDVAPDFDTPDVGSFEIDKPVIGVTDEHIDRQIKHICKIEGDLGPVEQAEAGHYIIGHGTMRLPGDGEPVLDVPGAVVQVPEQDAEGKGMILGVIVDDLSAQLGTPKVDDELTVTTTGPANHEIEKIRDQPIELSFKVESTQSIIPMSIENLVSRSGMADETQLREAIELQLNKRAVLEQQSAMREQVARRLLESVDFELPERLSKGQTERNLARRRYDLLHRGVPQDEVEKRLAEMRGSSAETAQRELKLFFILSKIAKEQEIEVQEEEVRGRIAQIAAEQRSSPAEIADQLQRNNQLPTIVQQIREHKVIDAILEKATLTEIPVEDYNAKVRGTGSEELSEVEPAVG
ncbi:MAG: trigger factor [Planctomycetota bacterium]